MYDETRDGSESAGQATADQVRLGSDGAGRGTAEARSHGSGDPDPWLRVGSD